MRYVPQVSGPLVRELSFVVTAAEEAQNLEQFLRGKGCSHHVLLHLKHTQDGILLNGNPVFSSQILKEGDVVTLQVREPAFSSESHLPEAAPPLSVLYEDADLLVINKPAGLPVYRSRNVQETTLADAARAYFAARGLPFTFHCINRLDRDTSGVLILARHLYSAALLGAAAEQRAIRREYIAAVEGILPAQGTIHAPIARKPDSPLMREVNEAEGADAVTHFQRLSAHEDPDYPGGSLSIARILLETGRTHQIRVHMKHIGHPLFGDFLYNPGHTEIPGSDVSITRQALHARRIRFLHPVTGRPVTVTAPWPEDFLPLLHLCGLSGE